MRSALGYEHCRLVGGFRHPTPTVEKRSFLFLRCLALGSYFVVGGEVRISESAVPKVFHRILVICEPLRLEIRSAWPAAAAAVVGGPFVPVEAQPLEAVENRLEGLGHVPLGIGIVDPQQELPAVLPGKEPIKERRADAADMQIAGRTGSEAGTDGHWN